MRKYFFQTLLIIIVSVIWYGCGKTDNEGDRYTINGDGTGKQEVPVVTTNGNVKVTGTYLAKSKELRYSVSFTNLSTNPTMMHFHGPADPGANADVLVPVTAFPQSTSGNFSGVAALTTTNAQESALLAGKMYFNILTGTYPNGEVRAQIGVTKVN